jgi:hypothetical protein
MRRRTRILCQLPVGMSDQSHRLDRSESKVMGSMAHSTREQTHPSARNEATSELGSNPFRDLGTKPLSRTGNEATYCLRTKPSSRQSRRIGINSFEENGLRRFGAGLTIGPLTLGRCPRTIRSQLRRRNEADFGPTASERTQFRSPASERTQFRFPAIGRVPHPFDPCDRLGRTVLLGQVAPESQVEGASS